MNVKTIDSVDLNGKFVIVRGDLDVSVDEHGSIVNDSRIQELIPTLNKLLEKGVAKVCLIGHRGRPTGFDQTLTLSPIYEYLKVHFAPDTTFVPHKPIELFPEMFDDYSRATGRLVLLDNLRFFEEEEKNGARLNEELSFFGEYFVNESFATSHREHASTFGLPQLLNQKHPGSSLAGLHLEEEITHLEKVIENPARPLTIVISGLKQDKLDFLNALTMKADKVLVAGRLPEFMPEDNGDPKVLVAKLIPDKEDITIHSIEMFEETIASSRTVFVSGPIGHFEEEGHMLGTKRVFEAIAASDAIKIAGGGDTTTAIMKLHLENHFDWISTGGGASLEFVAKGTLPGIEVLKEALA
ncbi:phosphoglycerate kinase [Candidatus Woesebacteria bacterium]|jgi:phosphoglycerate kinase|nr:phosphoglycerate kinase [Candidatus Woesebacteria bacterium]